MRRHYQRLNGKKLITAMVLAGLLFGGAFFLRALQTANADAKICRKVDRVTVALIRFVEETPVPRDPDPQAQRRKFLAAMETAACDPANLPSTGGAP